MTGTGRSGGGPYFASKHHTISLAIVFLLIHLFSVPQISVVCRCLIKACGGGDDAPGAASLSSSEGVSLLKVGMAHPSKEVRSMCIHLIKGMSGRGSCPLLVEAGLLVMVAEAVKDREISVANAASNALLHAAEHAGGGGEAVFGSAGGVIRSMVQGEEDAIVQMRGLELVAR